MTPAKGRLLIRGGRLLDPSLGIDGRRDLLIEDGRVAEVAESIPVGAEVEVVEAAGLVVAPGLIDLHVHLREPGQEYKETVETGTRAAAAGGFTAVASMPNTVPVNDNRAVTQHILTQAARHGYARVHPVAAVSKGQKGAELCEFGELVEAGAAAFSDDGLPVANSDLMRRALLYARHFGRPLMQHAEDLALTGNGVMHEGMWSTRLGLPGIPGVAEDVLIARDLILAEETGGRYHLQHTSTARGLELVRAARARGVAASCEVSAHHLLLTDEEVAKSGISTNTKMKPPLRSEQDREALVAGLADGSIEVIASDHAPHHADEKDRDYTQAPFGIVGLETTLPLVLDRLVRPGLVSLGRVIEALTVAPARVLGLEAGSLRRGNMADLTLIDLERELVVDPSRFQSKSRNTPFAGWKLRGAAVATYLAGRRVVL
ncbi:MAG: dihydroorotase [Thermoanaerobaculia bacterium]